MPTPITEQLAALHFTGIAKETTFNTPVTATSWFPVTGNTLGVDPGLFFPPVMQAQRDAQIYALNGEMKLTGAIEFVLVPSAVPLIKAAVGTDQYQTGTLTGWTGTLASAASAGATTVSITATGGTPAVNDMVMIGSPTSKKSEVRKISGVTGSGPYICTIEALTYAHASAEPASKLDTTKPYTHYLAVSNRLDSLTIEKSLVNQSLQFSGARVGKLTIKDAPGNNATSVTADVTAAGVSVLATPSTPTFQYDTPFVFAEASINLGSQTGIGTVTDLQITLDNSVKPTYTLGAYGPSLVTPTQLKVNGTLKVVYQSLNDSTYGYLAQTLPPTAKSSLAVTWAHAGTGQSVAVTLPHIRLSKHGVPVKLGDILIEELGFEAAYDVTTASTITWAVTSSQYLPF